MAEKGFGVKEVNLIGPSGTPTITSPNNLNLNAVNVAISTNVSIGGTLSVTGNVSIGGTLTYEDVTNIDSVGIVTAREGIKIPDDKKLQIGNNQDIEIYHTSNESFIRNKHEGNYFNFQSGVGASGGFIFKNEDNDETYAILKKLGVELYYNDTKRLETSNTGATVTGTLVATTFSGSGASLTSLPAANLTGTLPAISGANLTNLPVTDPSNSDIQVVYTVTANGSSAYRFAGNGVVSTADNPDLYLIRGQKYRFINNSGGSHPFQIREASGGTAYSTGVTNNGASSGNIDFAPTNDSPAQLVYQCTSHGGMVGNIYLRDAGGQNTNVGLTTFVAGIDVDGGPINIINGGGAYNTHLNYNDSGINYVTSSNGGSTVFRGSNNNVTGMVIQGSGPVDIYSDLRHLSDTDTKISFPSTDTISFDTAGSERLIINSTGKSVFKQNNGSTNNAYQIVAELNAQTTGSTAANFGPALYLSHTFSGVNYAGSLITSQTDSDVNTTHISFYPRNYGWTEALRIASNGNVVVNSATNGEAKLDVHGGVAISSNSATVSPSGYDLKIRSNTGKLGIHIDNSSGTPTLEFGTGNATTGGAITTNSHGIFLKPAGADKLKVEPDGIRSFATVVDTSYHANPDPFGDGSGIVYYRLNDNFHDSGIFAQHGTSKQGGDPTFAFVNSDGERCWNNPTDGAITIPNLKNSYPFSMAAWVNISSWPTSSNNDLIMNLSIGGQRVSLCIVKWSDRTTSDWSIMYGGANHHVFPASSRPTNEWIHVVYSVVASNNTSHAVYQNGSALSDINKGPTHGGSAGWAIGGNATNSERFAMGRIGSIRFFNKAISSSEASNLYTNDTFYT